MITGNATVCGVMGRPVGHTLSPLLHNYFSEAMGIDYIYVPCLVEDEAVGEAVRGAYALGFTGLNVMIPHKRHVIPYLTDIDETARSAGAVNTLVRTENGYKGYNTDVEGLCRSMKEQGMEIRGRDCLLIGAGGAARAAAYLLKREGAASLTILNRSPDRAEDLAAKIAQMPEAAGEPAAAAVGEQASRQISGNGLPAGNSGEPAPDKQEKRMKVRVMALSQWDELDGHDYLAVQTTSVGMYPDPDHAPVEDPAFYARIRDAVDLIYNPYRTRFMRAVEAAGGRAAGGLDMLIYQGAASFELWRPDIRVPAEVIAGARKRMEERLHG